eukprot:2212868-Amphidinium_carterae.1
MALSEASHESSSAELSKWFAAALIRTEPIERPTTHARVLRIGMTLGVKDVSVAELLNSEGSACAAGTGSLLESQR